MHCIHVCQQLGDLELSIVRSDGTKDTVGCLYRPSVCILVVYMCTLYMYKHRFLDVYNSLGLSRQWKHLKLLLGSLPVPYFWIITVSICFLFWFVHNFHVQNKPVFVSKETKIIKIIFSIFIQHCPNDCY